MLPSILIHADAVVANLEYDVGSFSVLAEGVGQARGAGAKGYYAALGHSIYGIEDDVGQGFADFELVAVE